jgi:hypothetical protein
MLHSARWRAKAMKYIALAQTEMAPPDKRRHLNLATSCMRYAVRLAATEAPPLADNPARWSSRTAKRN